jgi:hypothetical protein
MILERDHLAKINPTFSVSYKRVRNVLKTSNFKYLYFHTHAHSSVGSLLFSTTSRKHTGGGGISHYCQPFPRPANAAGGKLACRETGSALQLHFVRGRWCGLDRSSFWILGPGVVGADMGSKIFIALPLVVLHHFVDRIAGGWALGIEEPCACGTTPASESLFIEPNQFAAHDLPRTRRELAKFRLRRDFLNVHQGRLECPGAGDYLPKGADVCWVSNVLQRFYRRPRSSSDWRMTA